MALVLTLASLVAGLAVIYALPRLANAFLVEGRVYPLYGFHHGMQQIVELFSNSRFFNLMFGDSVFIEPYLRFVGWKLGLGDQTGSNFGSEQGQDNPFLCSVGANTVASDSLWLGNLTLSSHAFRLGACRIGENNFLGTSVYVPPGARTGDNVLFATKVMAPIDGPVRENVGLLGSPAFEIPRAASRDLDMLAAIGPEERARRLRRKTCSMSPRSPGLLASRWLVAFLAIYVFGWTAEIFGATSVLAMTAATGVVVALSAVVFILIERASIGFGRLEPAIATVYDPVFWRVERHWKLSDNPLATAFAGTPMRNADLAPARRQGRPQGVRRRLHSFGAHAGRDRRRGEPQRAQHHSVALARRRRVQVRHGAHRRRRVGRRRRAGALWRDDGRGDPSRRRRLPDEGRDHAGRLALARQSGEADLERARCGALTRSMAESAGRDGFDCAPLRAALAPLGVLFGARRIRPGDETAFADPGLSRPASLARRRASGAARIVARDLLTQLGADAAAPLPRSPSGAPEWPAGVIGSLAHDDDFAVAAVARGGVLAGLGVDIEPAEPLPSDLVDLVLSAAEQREAKGDAVRQRLVFVAKEAVYKAIHPLDGTPLEYADIEVVLGGGEGDA